MDGFFGISFWEILLIFLIGLILVGPRNLPAMAAKAGRAYRRLKRASQDLTSELTKEVGIEEDKKIENPLRKIASDFNSDLSSIKKDLNVKIDDNKKPGNKAQEQAEGSNKKT
ncbi:MAG: twin-arginine translocase TatA/TatE family subunit [Dehalococcoidia bacterium]